MNKSDLIAIAAVCWFLVAGCISTTVGVPAPEPDDPGAAELNYQLGARYFRAGNYDLARDRLIRSIELEPKNPLAHTTLALTYEQLGNRRLATESYKKAVRVAPRDFNVQNAYAVYLCRQGDYETARRYFDKAIDVRENDNAEVMMTNAGVCMAQKPDVAAAESYLRQALARRANYPEALLQMSVLKHQSGDSLTARAFLQRFLAANEPTATVLFLGHQIEDSLGDDRARREFADQILRDFPESAEARQLRESG